MAGMSSTSKSKQKIKLTQKRIERMCSQAVKRILECNPPKTKRKKTKAKKK